MVRVLLSFDKRANPLLLAAPWFAISWHYDRVLDHARAIGYASLNYS